VPLSLNVRQTFTVDLRVLAGKISEIGSLTDKQITEAIEALVKHDVTLASHFAVEEDRGNAL
jgi:hypothetical protein